MKDPNNLDSLIRDLDTLGVQDEISMDLTIEEMITSSNIKETIYKIETREDNRHNPKEEYEACLSYNDHHKVKIARIEGIIKIDNINCFLRSADNSLSIEIKLRVEFSDNSHLLIFKRDQVVETYLEYGSPGERMKYIWSDISVYNNQIKRDTIISLIDHLIIEIKKFPNE